MSVVIPVYNPGKYIDPCVDSLLAQTLPAEDFEVLFVDDGSTDDTPARLDKLSDEHPHFRAIHIPNSGWPGKPRNIGVAEAAGEYVHFLDQDDHLASDALRRLYEMGHRNGSDIVIGKVASNFRGVPHGVFRTTREKCDLTNAPLYDSLTPHKMFRTEFLRENGIAYPEGKRRLEDQLYMMQAYFPAKVVSILGNYTCYYYSKRDDGQNAGSARIVPSGYYGNLREVLEVVENNTEPGEFRDRLLRRFYRVEMLARLSEPSVLGYTPEYLDEMCDAVGPLARDFMHDGVHDGLGALTRLRSTLLRADDREGLLKAAAFAKSVTGVARLEDFVWEPDGRIALTVTGRLVHGEDRRPLRFVRRDGRYFLHPEITEGVLPDGELLDVTDDMDEFKGEMSLRNRETAVEWPCPAEFTVKIEKVAKPEREPRSAEEPKEKEDVYEVVLRGTGRVTSEAVKGRGRVSRGFWDVWVPLRGLGLVRKARLGADRAPQVDAKCLPALLGTPGRPVIPYFTDPYGNLTLDVAGRGKKLAPYLADRPVFRMPGGRSELRLDVFTGTASGSHPVELVLTAADGTSRTAPATLRPDHGRAHLDVPPRVPGLPVGPARLSVRLDGEKAPELDLCEVPVAEGGRIRLDRSDLPQVDPLLVRVVTVQRRRASVRRVLRSVGGPIVRRLPPATRKKVRRLAARL
ncbi:MULTISPECIES: glycosyltransferase family 2 protein [unclassified Streptomyces]|uniref:glycosyltransferase family 2 protein n=1 Tax=unclassified Streptomyces TaxID=2593676 RepID=UPI002E2960F4|nr:glycosyltransferase family A protein [Streptomyces sp. NBC_01429]